MASPTQMQTVRVGGAQIDLQNVQLRPDVVLDSVHLEGGDILLEPPAGEKPGGIFTGETRFQAVMSEPNLNMMLEANMPPDVPVKNFRVALLSGRARISMQVVKMLSLPITLEAVPRIENGVRVTLDWHGMSWAGISIPPSLVEVFQQQLNKNLDVSNSPIPIWLDEVRCEPGRLVVAGKARIVWPPVAPSPSSAPFTAHESPAVEPAPAQSALPPASE